MNRFGIKILFFFLLLFLLLPFSLAYDYGFFVPAYFSIDAQKTAELNRKFDFILVGSTSAYSGINSEKAVVMVGPAPFEANSESFVEEWNYISTHEDWFLHSTPELDPNTRVTNPGYPHLYYMDLGSAGWKDYVVSEYLERAQNNPSIDGVFIDEVYDPPTYVSILGSAYPAYNASQYEGLMSDLIAGIKSAVGSKMVILNSDLYKPITLQSSGGIDEGFVHFAGWPNSRIETKAQWLSDISQISDADFNEKYLLIGSGSLEETLPSMVEYTYASFLLGFNPNSHSYFYWHSNAEGGYQTLFWSSLWEKDIGQPSGSYFLSDGLYQRNFSNGRVLVNPNDSGNAITVDLGSAYLDSSGNTVSSITLSNKTAAVLLKTETPALQQCTENWQCTAWSACINGIQTRSCTDLNNCGTSLNKPPLSQQCSSSLCTSGQTQTCTTEGCFGQQSCVLGNWGSCVKDDKCCGITCKDSDACTIDYCVSGTCIFEPVRQCCAIDCSDSDLCTVDYCQAGECRHEKKDLCCGMTCNDSNACTADRCILGECVFIPLVNCAEGVQGLVVSVPPIVIEGAQFTVKVTDENNYAVEGALIEAGLISKKTNEKGEASFYAPPQAIYKSIIVTASKEEYNSGVEVITIKQKETLSSPQIEEKCGNQLCDANESSASCPQDCKSLASQSTPIGIIGIIVGLLILFVAFRFVYKAQYREESAY